MEKICKKISWINVASLAAIVVGMIFGILAINELKFDDTNSIIKYILIGVLVIVTVISLISGLITFFGMRKGQVKTAVLGMGRNSAIQIVGPLTAFILGLIGLCNQENVNSGLVTFLCVMFVIAVFATGLIANSMRGYRKDKETYTYTGVVSFIAAASLVIFAVAALIGEFQLPKIQGTYVVGFLITFSVCFSLADILCYIGLGILAIKANKYAPEKTAADADAKVLDQMLDGINKINENQTKTNSVPDNVSQLREYKKLFDEGVITKEEFETKKKELLK